MVAEVNKAYLRATAESARALLRVVLIAWACARATPPLLGASRFDDGSGRELLVPCFLLSQ
eukprot:14984550-Alexandrium_andersonii.AAC.1